MAHSPSASAWTPPHRPPSLLTADLDKTRLHLYTRKRSLPHLQKQIAPPTQPGAYWFHSETAPWEILVEVTLNHGQLTVSLLNRDVMLANLNGRWRGPIRPFGEPSGR